MKPVFILLIVFSTLIGCSGKEANPQAGRFAESPVAAEADGARNKYLAYEHSISVDTTEDGTSSLYEKIISTCKADKPNGCTLLDSNLTTGRSISAQIKIQAKPAGIKNIIGIVSAGGELINQATHVEDLALPITDNNKRLEMLKQYQLRLMKLEQKANNDVDALIKVSKELATVQSEIEQAAGQSVYLLERVNLEVLTISIGTHINRSFWSPIANAVADFSGDLSNGISSTVWALAYILPWSIILLIFVVIVRKLWRRKKI
ncbi:MAG: DUF4349 domain-containing protein [Gammaproteobacteria bacterium]|nr:DUF4349 domain-containing protein [Gammaproteobacteria bacterium]